ncbi:NADP-dependent oxidoreductase [Rhodococcus oxybenzonivorans]|uniref:NADP-dependent oxidoreductase n=1 Tax=Rhodococcus oxybenzonivorans TaxID=1990687 RepID=UPI002953683C|nr:NADP-dependent oxidoreductase [Rhodococcus oxybenzonivorans]MDV7356188.1 NADP-dependent oxidoreductase [Rhodococcus oxybenzonivorans]
MTRRVVARGYGGPEVLTVVEVDPVPPARGEVAIEVRAIGVNPIDYKRYSGAFGTDPDSLPMGLGAEAAGVIVEVGEDATGPDGPLSPGDEVIAYPVDGAYADRLVVGADSVVRKPPSLPWNEAAGLLVAGTTAVETLDVIQVGSGDLVLVHGAAGAVGSCVVQVACGRGATVIGTARPGHHDYVRSLGATPVSYGDGLADRVRVLAPDGVDAVIDTVGGEEAVDVSVASVRDPSRMVTTLAVPRAVDAGFLGVGGKNPASREVRRRLRSVVVDLADRGDLRVRVARTYWLAEAGRAHTELASPHPAGKFVLLP